MKELSIEEKAKRYDEAIEKLRSLHDNYDTVSTLIDIKEELEEILPELKESEDERIRKAIIKGFENFENFSSIWNDDITVKDCITWLKKQDEVVVDKELSDLLNKVICHFINEPKIPYSERDEVSKKIIPYVKQLEKQGEQKPVFEMKTPEESLGIDSDTYNKIVDDCIYGEQKPTDKVEPKFKVGDYIERKDGLGCHAKIIFVGGNVYGCEKLIHSEDKSPFFEFMFKNQDEFQISSDFKQKPADADLKDIVDKEANAIWKEINTGGSHSIIDSFNQFYGICMQVAESVVDYRKPAEWIQELESKLSNATPEQLAEWKEKYFKVEPVWSEDDETVLDNLIYALANDRIGNDRDEYISWLNSLKDRVQPQPKQEWSKGDNSHIQSILVRLEGMCEKGNIFTVTRYALSEDINWLKSLRPQNTWKPSDEQMTQLKRYCPDNRPLTSLYEQLKKLKE